MQKRAPSNLHRRAQQLLGVEPLEERWLLNSSFSIPKSIPLVLAPDAIARTLSHEMGPQLAEPGRILADHSFNLVGPLPSWDYSGADRQLPGPIAPKMALAEFGDRLAEPSLVRVAEGLAFLHASNGLSYTGPRHEPVTGIVEVTPFHFFESFRYFPSPGDTILGNSAFDAFRLPLDAGLPGEGAGIHLPHPGVAKWFAFPRPNEMLRKAEDVTTYAIPPLVEALAMTVPSPGVETALRAMPFLRGEGQARLIALLVTLATNPSNLTSVPQSATVLSEVIPVAGNFVPEHLAFVSPTAVGRMAAPVVVHVSRGSETNVSGPRISQPRSDESVEAVLPEDSPAIASIQQGITLDREQVLAPQGASLLTKGVSLGVAGLERAVQALVEPMLDAEGKPTEMLHLVGISSWLLAAALACEGIRRRLPQHETRGAIYPVGLPHLSPERQP